MLKLLVAGDLHYRGNNPRARLDDFPGAMRRKLTEVLKLAEEHGADYIIQLGDLFDTPTVSLSSVAEIAGIVRGAEIPFLSIPGNHDLFGANLSSVSRTPYGFLANMGFVRDLHRAPISQLDPELGYTITGHAYDTDTDREIEQYLIPESILKENDNAIHIRVVHGMILDKRPGFEMRHTLLSDIAMQERAPHILLTGHDHTGFGVKNLEAANSLGQMIAINPGALCRLSAHASEFERQVQVCLVKIPGPSIDVTTIPLDSARPGHEVLSREHLEAQAERESQIAEFLGLIAEEGEVKFLEVREILEDIAEREKLPRDVVEEALKRIGEVREGAGLSGRF